MIRFAPFLVLAVSALGGAAISTIEPQPLRAQEAPCSWGTEILCMKEVSCVRRGFEFQLWPFRLAIAKCIETRERYLYYKPIGGGSAPGGDHGDEPPGDEGNPGNA